MDINAFTPEELCGLFVIAALALFVALLVILLVLQALWSKIDHHADWVKRDHEDIRTRIVNLQNEVRDLKRDNVSLKEEVLRFKQ